MRVAIRLQGLICQIREGIAVVSKALYASHCSAAWTLAFDELLERCETIASLILIGVNFPSALSTTTATAIFSNYWTKVHTPVMKYGNVLQAKRK
jgi:hypothetical protein